MNELKIYPITKEEKLALEVPNGVRCVKGAYFGKACETPVTAINNYPLKVPKTFHPEHWYAWVSRNNRFQLAEYNEDGSELIAILIDTEIS